jgi:acyl carrier protein
MTRQEILKDLNPIFADILSSKIINLTENSDENGVDGWESLCHIQIIVAIENKFGIRFSAAELRVQKNVGLLIDIISSKLEGSNKL